MQYALTAAEALRAEQEAISHGAVTLESLMDRAGGVVAETITDVMPQGPVAVLTGKGNNGGDGWVAARLLHEQGREVRVFALVGPEALSGAARSAARAARAAGVSWTEPEGALDLAHGLVGFSVIVDALFGFGLKGAPAEPYASAIAAVDDSDAFVLAIDLPSGVHADTGVVAGPAVNADMTVTFSAPKTGILLEPGASHAGEIVVSDIGVPRVYIDREGCLEIWDTGDYRSLMPVPVAADHKGTRGRVLVVAGSRAFAGAAVLTATGASRMGAGYVFAAVPAAIAPIVQTALPHVITHSMHQTPEGTLSAASADRLIELCMEVDAVVVGPGLAAQPETVHVIRRLVAETDVPMLLDADGLNAFDAVGPDAITGRKAPTIVTPHPGELARLLGIATADVQADRVRSASELGTGNVTCLLKGARTLVSGGGRVAVTLSGNPGMATAGMGDVLSGMIGTLLSQGLSSYDAATLGAYLHGRAGDAGAEALTRTCLTAGDMGDFIPVAVRELLGE